MTIKKRKRKQPQSQPSPEVGMGVTCFGKKGRYPGTIVAIDCSPKSGQPDGLVVQLDKLEGEKIVPDLEGEIQEFLLNYKKKIWVRVHRKYKTPKTDTDGTTNGGLMTLPWSHKNRPDIFFGQRLKPQNDEL